LFCKAHTASGLVEKEFATASTTAKSSAAKILTIELMFWYLAVEAASAAFSSLVLCYYGGYRLFVTLKNRRAW
jgi:hypothetical protein